MRFAALPVAMAVASAAYGVSFVPITPSVDHSKKATCGIKWKSSQKSQTAYFVIYRGMDDDFFSSDQIAEVSNSTESFTDWGADQYQHYWYWVVPFDSSDMSNIPSMSWTDLANYACMNHRFWGKSDVYLTVSSTSVAIDSMLPLYFKVNMGTAADPVYDHVKPDRVVFTRSTNVNGNNDSTVAYVLDNYKYDYTTGYNTYLRGSGAFGYLYANKPGVVYLRAYYKSATTVNPLRVEIKKPTFELRAPEGEIDILDNNYRNLYLKCNGKFTYPEVLNIKLGGSTYVCLNAAVESTLQGKDVTDPVLYDNSFGFLFAEDSDEDPSMFELKYRGERIKEFSVTSVWNGDPSLVLMDSSGNKVNSPSANTKYWFGIEYRSKKLPHKATKGAFTWSTYNVVSSSWLLLPDVWDVDFSYASSSTPISKTIYSETDSAPRGELGTVTFSETGRVNWRIGVLGREIQSNFMVK